MARVHGNIEGGVPNMVEYGPIFVAENGNVVHISADSDTKITVAD